MPFAIRIAREPSSLPEAPGSFFEGLIEIDSFREKFWASAAGWSREDYIAQWRQGLRRVCEEGFSSALITSFSEAAEGEAAIWWPIVVDGPRAILWQEHRFPGLQNKPTLTPNNWISQLPGVRPAPLEGHPVSEWIIPVADLGQAWSKNGYDLGSSTLN